MLLKTRLHEHLFKLLETRISELSVLRTQISHDSTESGKGSAGDKHEVGIAMAQLEIEKIDGQINLLQQQHAALKRIDAQQAHTQIQTGSIFMCNEQWFYCSIAFGQLEFEQTSVFCLSPEAPLYLALKGKKVGETALLNGKTWKIEAVS